ncbi:GNAT family N-acetyltransferase [Desulfotomaculum defluvii]
MLEVRPAKKGDLSRQKEIWKLSFGDPQDYIDFYFDHRYKEDETLLLLEDGEVASMLTMIPVKTMTSQNHSFNTAMLYAIATHPLKQNRGYSTVLMDQSMQYLKANKQEISIVVPAAEQLFDFYGKRGYQIGFYIREVLLTRKMIDSLSIDRPCKVTISSISPEEYNLRRNQQLRNKLYIAYADRDIAYQKKLSRLSGANIYGVDCENIQGCLAIERVNSHRVLIKEILVPDGAINGVIKLLAQHMNAEEFICRTPAFLGDHLGGHIRPFAMVKVLNKINVEITANEFGYLGFAFD